MNGRRFFHMIKSAEYGNLCWCDATLESNLANGFFSRTIVYDVESETTRDIPTTEKFTTQKEELKYGEILWRFTSINQNQSAINLSEPQMLLNSLHAWTELLFCKHSSGFFCNVFETIIYLRTVARSYYKLSFANQQKRGENGVEKSFDNFQFLNLINKNS